jgi:DNA repair protein RadC
MPERMSEQLTILPATEPEQLNEIELLALTLGHSSPRRAARLLSRFRGVHGLARASFAELELERVPQRRARQLLAALELGRRTIDRPLRRGAPLSSSTAVADYLGGRLVHREQEELHVVGLDVRHQVVTHFIAAVGCDAEVHVDPRDVFRPLVRHNAHGCVVVHNHPSGEPAPSDADRALTQQLAAAADLIGVRFLDHVIIAAGGTYSFAGMGALRG